MTRGLGPHPRASGGGVCVQTHGAQRVSGSTHRRRCREVAHREGPGHPVPLPTHLALGISSLWPLLT